MLTRLRSALTKGFSHLAFLAIGSIFSTPARLISPRPEHSSHLETRAQRSWYTFPTASRSPLYSQSGQRVWVRLTNPSISKTGFFLGFFLPTNKRSLYLR